MFYQGGAWPEEYRGKLFMGNIHGHRHQRGRAARRRAAATSAATARTSCWRTTSGRPFINLKYGPDGNVYLIDWYDKQACHRNEPEIWDRTNGRIYKISYQRHEAGDRARSAEVHGRRSW